MKWWAWLILGLGVPFLAGVVIVAVKVIPVVTAVRSYAASGGKTTTTNTFTTPEGDTFTLVVSREDYFVDSAYESALHAGASAAGPVLVTDTGEHGLIEPDDV
jgi:hypothetical protein